MYQSMRGLVIIGTIFHAVVWQHVWADLVTLKQRLDDVQVAMPEPALRSTLDAIHAQNASEFSQDLDRLLSQWMVPLSVENTTAFPLKYNDPPIVEMVLHVYIAKVEQERAYSAAIRQGDETSYIGGGSEAALNGEAAMDFYSMLADMAESTLSESLYDYVWDYPQRSNFRRLYLAHVQPEKTVARLTEAELGRTVNGKFVGEDSLFWEGAVIGTPLFKALQYLADIALMHPDIREANREALRAFAAKHGLHYAPTDSETHARWRDYQARRAAMQILDVTGTPEDLPLLEALAHDAPGPDEARRIADPEDLSALSVSIAATLRLSGIR